MNTLFEKLLQESSLAEKDKHDIKQIFCFLCNEKKQRLMRNFPILCANIEKINEDTALEQKILFENMITDLDEMLNNNKNKSIQEETKSSMLGLKGEL